MKSNVPLYSSSFVGASRIKTLVVPIGNWDFNHFKRTLINLQENNQIQLLDITPVDSPLFNPQGFPNGRLYFDFLTSINDVNNPLDLFLYDFEPFRKAFVLIGLVNDNDRNVYSEQSAKANLQQLKQKFPTVISYNLVYCNSSNDNDKNITISDDETLSNVFKGDLSIIGILKTILGDVGKNFLIALNHYYSSYKHVTLRSPGAIGGNSVLKTGLLKTSSNSSNYYSSTTTSSLNSSSLSNNKRISTSNIKRSASLKFARSITTTDNKVQQRSQGRQFKILGNFQLLAGRYLDALASFTEAATFLHLVKDYIWLASALDGIAMSLLLLSYLNLSYQVPQLILDLCPVENNILVSHSEPHHAQSVPPPDTTLMPRPSLSIQSPRNSLSTIPKGPHVNIESINLPYLIQTIAEKILHYYELSLSHNTEYAPQDVYCSFLIKTLSYMTVCNSDSKLSPKVLDRIVNGINDEVNDNLTTSKSVDTEDPDEELPNDKETVLNIQPPLFSKQDVYSFAGRIFDINISEMSVVSQIQIYLPLSEIYGALYFNRKKCFVLRLLLSTITSNLEKIHWNSFFSSFIIDMIEFYGIESFQPERMIKEAALKSSWKFQKDALQYCISVSNKVQDDDLTAKLVVMLVNRYNNILSDSDQRHLLKDVIRPLVINKSISKYWDNFLLRSVSITRLEFTSSNTLDNRSSLPQRTEIFNSSSSASEKGEKEDTPSNTEDNSTNISSSKKIFNPFTRNRAPTTVTDTPNTTLHAELLVGDRAEVCCVLQNPYKFEISITSIQFDEKILQYCELYQDEVTFDHPFFIAPESFAKIILPIRLLQATPDDFLSIDSLNISVFGLQPQPFKIVKEEARSPYNKQVDELNNERAIYDSYNLKIISEQPELEIVRTHGMTENSWMVLDGIKKKVSVTIRNKSLKTAIDYIDIKNITDIELSLKSDYWKTMSPDDLYTKEKQLQWLKNDFIKFSDRPGELKPNETATFEMEIDTYDLPPEFNEFYLIINYGSYAESDSYVYMRTLRVPYKMTVKRSIEVPNMEIIPINQPFCKEMEHIDWIGYFMKKLKSDDTIRVSDYVLLLLDLRNSWTDAITLSLEYDDFKTSVYSIESNHTTRIIVPVKRFSHNDCNFSGIAIPKIFQGRQFIRNIMNPEQLSDIREKFWCRENILKKLNCTWELRSKESISGKVNFGQFINKFDARMVTTIYTGRLPFEIKIDINNEKPHVGDQLSVKVNTIPINTKQHHLSLDSVFLNFMIFDNHTSKLLPKKNQRLFYNGMLSRTLPVTETSEVELDLMPIEKGEYEVSVCISEGPNSDSILQFSNEAVTFCVE